MTGKTLLVWLFAATLPAGLAQSWTQKVIVPESRGFYAAAFDAGLGQYVLFGGVKAASGLPLSDTWVWDGTNWTLKTPLTSPPARWGAAMVYDPVHAQTVLFGGFSAAAGSNVTTNPALNDTWVWDGGNWTQMSPATSPPARYLHTLGYDSHNGNAVLFGGTASTNAAIFHGNTVAMNDTWLWDGANWSLVTPAQSPSARSQSAAAYDSVHQRLILFGGAPGPTANNTLNDTWAWDGTNWTHLSSASPSPRSGHAMSFDPVAQKIVLYGGDPESAVNHVLLGGAASALELNDTWTWNGTAWTVQTPAATPYRGRPAMVAAYDAVRQQTVFFGGMGSGLNAYNSDTWIWNGSTWSSPPQTVHATARFGGAAVYDAGHQQVVVFGGTIASQQDDTWIWDGTYWTRHAAGGPTSQQCKGVYDAARQKVLLFLANGATWTWDGTSWSQENPITVPDPEDFALSYDAQHQQVVLFGLSGTSQTMKTWLWNGSNWTLQSPAGSPSNRFGISMTYDATRQRTVLFGGIDLDGQTDYSDTWLWDGSNWTQASPTNHPAARAYAAMDYDSSASRMMLFGGSTGGELSHSVVGDTWSWDGSNWTQLFPLASPSARDVHAMAYDAAHQTSLIFGGFNANSDQLDDTWVYSSLFETAVTITAPAGVGWSLDGFPFTGTQTVNLPLGAHTLGTTSPQGEGTGTQAVWISWSDAGAQAHLISVGATAVNITGVFHTQYLLTTASVPSNEGSAIPLFPPASAPYYDSGSVVTIQASPNAGFDFEHWGGACSGSTSLCLVAMTAPMSVNASFAPSLLWVPVFPTSSPPALVSGAMAYDSIRQETVLFGGVQGDLTRSNGTWIWDGTNWAQRFPAASPPARSYHGMAYDAARQQTVLFGGISQAGLPTDTWVWDGAAGTWTQKNPATAPSGRAFFAMTYDAAHQQVVLFGGTGSNGLVGDTWLWDGVNWTLKNPAASPSARINPALVFDGARQQVVLFGGANEENTTQFSDTWVWNGSTWTAKTPAIIPPGRGFPIAGYDALVQQVVLFSGDTTDNDNGTWLWDGTNWQQKSYPILPTRRTAAMGAYDAARQQLVLYGGVDLIGSNEATVFNDDTWVYTNSLAVPAQYPLTLIGTPALEGTVTGRVSGQTGPNYFAGSKVQVTATPAAGYGFVSFSGDCTGIACTVVMTGPKTVTATFAAPVWVPLFPAASPSPREGAGAAYESVRQQTVLFGGVQGSTSLADTWTWNGANWTQMSPATVPPPRYFHAMAYDALHQLTVMFGGSSGNAGLNDTWVWDGATWTQKHPVHSPAPRWGSAIAYDPVRQQVVLFGGTTYGSTYADTWLWDGNDWTGMNLPGPPALYFASMTFDAARGQAVLFGGFSALATMPWLNATWLWNGSAWTQANPAVSPPGRSQAVMAYDPVLQQSVLFGGSVQGSIAADTWMWDGTNWTHPSYAPSPYYRGNSTMAYDEVRRELVVFGGGGLGQQNDTWVFTLTRSVPGQYPLTVAATPPQDGTAQANDTVGQAGPNYYAGSPVQVTVTANAGFELSSFSGDCTGITCNLAMNGPKSVTANFGPALNWVELFPPAQPQSASLSGFIEPVPLAYDAARQQTVLFGGPHGQTYGNQTWVWDGTGWTQKFPAHVPPGRAGHGLAYDPVHQQVVMFGGASSTVPASGAVLAYAATLSDTWVWDGTDWTQKSLGAGPSPRLNHALSWDGQHVVLFGGWVGNFTAATTLLSDTWTWDGNVWTQRAAGGPGGRSDFAMAYDATHGKVVLFSGFDAGANDTWLWDGAGWTQAFPLTSPPSGDFAMAYDAVRQEMVLFAQSLTTPQTWAWDGANWLQRTPANMPAPRDASGMAFDAARSQIVLFGGTYLGVFSDTWIYAPNVQQSTAITVQTVPAGLAFTVDGGAPQTAPQTILLTAGPHTLAVATQAGPAGTQYVFTSWSDDGAASDTITVGAAAATYTAAFKTQYQLTISASPGAGGTVAPATGGFYDATSAVNLAATANAGYQFNGWTGSVASAASASTSVTMSAPETVVANFSSLAGITIQTSPPGLQFSVDGGAAQTAPQTLALTPGTHALAVAATQAGPPGTQYIFTSWSDGGGASHSIAVGAAAATFTATFKTQYQLTISASPAAGGAVTPATGGFYDLGTAVPIAATANAGYRFGSWTGSVASASSASTTVTMSAPETVAANFSAVTAIVIQTVPAGLQFTVDGGVAQTAPQTLTLIQGSHSIAVAATQAGPAGTQYGFTSWSDGGAASHDITVGAAAATYTASFKTQYQLTISASLAAGGSFTPASGGFYDASSAVPVAAVANTGYQFAGWTGSVAAPASASTTVTMSAPETLTANFAAATAGLRFVPVTPCRIIDTRNAAGTFGGPAIPAGGTRNAPVPQSACGIPAAAQAYSLNITVVPPAALTYLTVWPTGQPQPNVSTLNSFDGRIVANAAIVPAGSNGSISLFASDATNAIVDINGYFAPAATVGSLSFYAATPCRVADTRNAPGAFGGPFLGAGSTRNFAIPSSACGIPSTAQSYSLNVTVVPHSGLGYLTIWPAGQPQPNVSTLNSLNGSVAANAAIVPAGAAGPGAVSVYVTDDTDAILDINGYFAPPGGAAALSFYPATPCRVADTRSANGTFGGPILGAGSTRGFPIPASACAIPSTAQAYALNVTVVPPAPLTYLTAWPAGQPQPVVSTLNAFQGQVVANAAIVPAGSAAGTINVFVSDATHLILDVNGYFAQ